jgi:hypothetical protein
VEIYDAYPRKVNPAAACAAIERVLRLLQKRGEPDPAGWLLAKVKAFAASPAGKRGRHTPYPQTWMDKGAYDTDEKEWHVGEVGSTRIRANTSRFARVGNRDKDIQAQGKEKKAHG